MRFYWFQATTPATPQESTPPFEPQARVYQAGLQRLARTALVASVGLLYQGTSNEEAQVTPTQPDTYTQPVQGPLQFQQAQRRYGDAVRILNPLLWAERADDTAAELTPGVIPPVLGPAAFRQTQADLARRARLAAGLGWTQPEDDSGPIVTTELYLQPVQGDRALALAQARARRTALTASALLWTFPTDTSTEVDTWTQPVQGTSALELAARIYRWHVAAMRLGWNPSTDVETQPDTYVQPTPGTDALGRALRLYSQRVVLSLPLRQARPEDGANVVADQEAPYTQPVQGARALQQAAQQRAQQVQIEQGLFHQSPDGATPPVTTAPHEDLHTLGAGPASHVGDQATLGGTWSGGS